MQDLQACASARSGIGIGEAFGLDKVNLYERLGHDAFVKLSTQFYNRVFEDEEMWFRDIFKDVVKEDAIRNQYEFFIQRMGGPPLFSERRGHPALIGRHRPFAVTDKAAERWLVHMRAALDSVPEIDDEAKKLLWAYLAHTAYFISAGLERINQQPQQ
eukprot:TRINITY_DN16566_c0_g1_i1.p1 TRINITY_DN16566_c0_g1~~TRINITY_DN16566_c0_g1_i1.p1  ORF type:complete len:158 (+),score=32.66 TRINITY_DN16566_c0_g1_i1:70-543(+)